MKLIIFHAKTTALNSFENYNVYCIQRGYTAFADQVFGLGSRGLLRMIEIV